MTAVFLGVGSIGLRSRVATDSSWDPLGINVEGDLWKDDVPRLGLSDS